MISQLENESKNGEIRIGSSRLLKQEANNATKDGKYLGWKNTIDKFEELTENTDRTIVETATGVQAEENLVKRTDNESTKMEKKGLLGSEVDNKTTMTTDSS